MKQTTVYQRRASRRRLAAREARRREGLVVITRDLSGYDPDNPTRDPTLEESPLLRDRKVFASDLMLMKDRAARLGLFKTMQAIEPATQAVGWEIAELMERKTK